MTSDATYLLNILAFLIAAVGVVFLFRRLKVSSVLGYLVAGMLIGPHVLKIITDPTKTHFLGELGVVFLLFTLGLDLPLQRLQSMRKYVLGIGIPQVFLTGVLFTTVGVLAGLSKETALLVGGAFSLSSTAVVMQLLNDRKELATRFGRVSLAVLLFQDLVVVLLLVLTTTLGTEGSNIFLEISYAILKAALALIIIIGLGYLVRPLYRAVAMSGNAELFMGTTFLVVLGISFVTEVSGLSMELGAFLAGILLAETEYRHQVEADIQPFRGLLLGVFFMSVGMGINITVFLNAFYLVLTLLILMLALKSALIFFISRFNGLKVSTSLRTAFLLAGGGEFVFVIFSPSVAQRFLPPLLTDILFLVVTLSMALTPLLAYLGKVCADKFQAQETHSDLKGAFEEVGELKGHVIIAGFGRVGQMLGELLASRFVPFVALDTDMRRVAEGREKGWPVFFGDAKSIEVLKAVGADNAKAVVITLNQMTPSVRTVMMLRRHFPDLPVCVRVKDHKHQDKLMNSGARLVIPETVEPTVQLATSVLHIVGIPTDEVGQLIDTFRRQQWLMNEGK